MFLISCFGKNISAPICVCMHICQSYWKNKKESELIFKKARNLGLEFSDFNSVARTWNVTDTGILCPAVNECLTLKLYSVSVPKQQNTLLTRHIWRLRIWCAILDLSLSSVQCLPCQLPGLLLTFNFTIGSCWQITSKWDQHRYVTHGKIQTERSFQKLVSTGKQAAVIMYKGSYTFSCLHAGLTSSSMVLYC